MNTTTKTRRKKKPTNIYNFAEYAERRKNFLPVGCSNLKPVLKKWKVFRTVTLHDDALEPIHSEGDELPCAIDFNLSEITCSRLCIVYIKSERRQIARIVCNNGLSDKIVLKAPNPAFREYRLDKDEFEIRGLVLTDAERKQYGK